LIVNVLDENRLKNGSVVVGASDF